MLTHTRKRAHTHGSFGDSLASKPVQAGQDKWKVIMKSKMLA
jgi:hypothetical protein